jgi:hypothetical protein
MLTIFSTPKPFRGHIGVIQRNAIKSWKQLHSNVEVILFGDDEGAAEACQDLAIRHEPDVRRNENGTKYLNYIFDRAFEISHHKFLCYVNCDIMLMSDFRRGLDCASKTHSQFLMVGRRWDIDISVPWDFAQAEWDSRLRSLALLKGKQQGPGWVDYFCFSRNLFYGKMPRLLIGRCWWDQWLIWRAKSLGAAVIDSTSAVMAVHQNHDYSYHPDGFLGTLQGDEAMENRRLAGGKWHLYTLLEATHRLGPEGERHNWGHSLMPVKRNLWTPLWFSFLDSTRPIRHRLGLRQRFVTKAFGRSSRPAARS